MTDQLILKKNLLKKERTNDPLILHYLLCLQIRYYAFISSLLKLAAVLEHVLRKILNLSTEVQQQLRVELKVYVRQNGSWLMKNEQITTIKQVGFASLRITWLKCPPRIFLAFLKI